MNLLFRRGLRRQSPSLRSPARLNPEAELVEAPSPDEDAFELPWWITPYGRWRFWAEITAMRRFPDFEPSRFDDEIRWDGRLTSALTSRRYVVRVTYPECFPDDAPRVEILHPRLPEGTPHVVSPQRPCLYRGGPRDGYDPGTTTAATLVAWTALWIHAFETWQSTGSWPGRGE